MRFRMWLYVIAGLVVALAAVLTFVDPGSGPFGDGGSRYLLGHATIPVILVAMLVTPLALFGFFRWLLRTQHDRRVRLWGVGSVMAAFVLGLALAWDWAIVWLVQGDIEIRFARDSFLPVVVGLVFACTVALVFWLVLRGRPSEEDGEVRDHGRGPDDHLQT